MNLDLAELDPTDARIVIALAKDGRLSWRDLAEQIGLSLTPTIRRVRRLEEEGLIRGYAARINRDRLNGNMGVFVSITLERQVEEVLASFEKAVEVMSEVDSGHLMSGGVDYLLVARVHDLEHYRRFLARLTRLDGIAHIQSSFILKTFTEL
jgi:DNA-binding Lrp family transcriptional regulator